MLSGLQGRDCGTCAVENAAKLGEKNLSQCLLPQEAVL